LIPEASFVPAHELLGEGDYYIEERTYSRVDFRLPSETCALLRNLQVIHGVGPVTEGKLKDEGYEDIESLSPHIRWGDQAKVIVEAVEGRDARFLRGTKASDWQVLALYSPEEMVFLDIETCGLTSAQPLFLIGMMREQEDDHMRLRQFFARSYEEEVAVLAAVKRELESAGVVVTYNGLRFDMPYIRDRMAYYGTCCPEDPFHFDLLRTARRLFRETLPNCKLVTVASYVLGYERGEDIPSYMIPEVYHDFVMNPRPALIRPILEHNAMDIHAMALLLAKIFRVGDSAV
jgi:uncharacterized protein YprB with RNaseH-like and TPR domain